MGRKAFTLIELIVVISLLLTLTGLSVAGFMRFTGARSLEQYTKEWVSYLRYLQFRAIEEGRVYKMAITEGKPESFKLELGKGYTPAKEGFEERLVRNTIFFPRFERSREIYFFPDGTMTKDSIVILESEEPRASIQIKNRVGTFTSHFYE